MKVIGGKQWNGGYVFKEPGDYYVSGGPDMDESKCFSASASLSYILAHAIFCRSASDSGNNFSAFLGINTCTSIGILPTD